MKLLQMKKVAQFREKLNSMDEKIGIRTTKRIKKAKVVFDPSDNYAPRSYRLASSSTASTSSTIPASHSFRIAEKRLYQQRSQNVDKGKIQASHGCGNSSSSLAVSDVSGGSIEGEKCVICHRREPRKGGKKLIACIDCENHAHLSCMKIMFEDLSILRKNYRCDDCHSCASCFEGPEDGALVTCSKCVKSFHYSCHIPSVTRLTQNGKWLCSKCTPKITNSNTIPAKNIREIIIGDVKLQKQQQQPIAVKAKRSSTDNLPHSSHSLPKQHKSSQQPQQQQQQQQQQLQQQKIQIPISSRYQEEKTQSQQDISTNQLPLVKSVEEKIQQKPQYPQNMNEIIQNNHNRNDSPEIPDVKEWSIEKVFNFFKKYFPNEAHVFQEHEIDGQSLLLLKRSDVIKKLPLKLGPSLRIYNLIVKIQSKSNDPTIGWLN